MDKLIAKLGVRTTILDGNLLYGDMKFMSTEDYYYATVGTKFELLDENYLYAIATYNLKRDLSYALEYKYLSNSEWISYNNDVDPKNYYEDEYLFKKECYYRICVKRKDGKDLNEEEVLKFNDLFKVTGSICKAENKKQKQKECFKEEIERVSKKINSFKKEDMFNMMIITDSHYALNGTWEDTISNIKKVSENIKLNAIAHLGDLTDGILNKKKTLKNAKKIISNIKSLKNEFILVLGNHDSNYFRNNKDIMSIEEQSKRYLKREKPYYYKDFKKQKISIIVLSFYDNNEENRYGFSIEEIKWLEKLLLQISRDRNIIVLSHGAPVKKLDYWAKEIRNSEKIMKILNKDDRIKAYFHGHTHADNIDYTYNFPIISIGCNKFEDFREYKPKGFITPSRKLNDKTQDLWDILSINLNSNKMHLTRFGAGEDRVINLERSI